MVDSSAPETPEPDEKDWTWVLTRPCPECGFNGAETEPSEVAGLLRRNTREWEQILAGPDVATRPAPDVWSALEYACHVRDVHRRFLERLELMLTEDDPLFANWDQDRSAIEDRYDRQDPATVSTELRQAADALAARFEQVQDQEWGRTGRRSDGASFTVSSFAAYFIHDPIHHVEDVRRSGQGQPSR